MKLGKARLHGLALAILSALPPVCAQTPSFNVLHTFTSASGPEGANGDGAYPEAGLIISGGTLFGTANNGGSGGDGTVFRVNIDGTDFTNLFNFTVPPGPQYTNSEGANPDAALFLSGNTLYGTASDSGRGGVGTVFSVNTYGSNFADLYNFTAPSGPLYTNSDGAYLETGLILLGNTLYGTAGSGGSAGNGTIFRVNADGSDFTNLHDFTALDPIYSTNGDGAGPEAGLIVSDGVLYGTTGFGGGSAGGTVFRINTDGSNFTTLYDFSGVNDGADPYGNLIISGGTLFGTTQFGGGTGNGTVFRINTDGSDFTNLYSFMGSDDGGYPYGGVVISGSVLYGTVEDYGVWGYGGIFALNTDGSDFTNLYSFTGGDDGGNPLAGLILSGNTLYGTATYGGAEGAGTVFALSLPVQPSLGIVLTNNQVTLTWPAWASNYDLQTTTNLSSSNWLTVSNSTMMTSVTLTNSLPAVFFRLQEQ